MLLVQDCVVLTVQWEAAGMVDGQQLILFTRMFRTWRTGLFGLTCFGRLVTLKCSLDVATLECVGCPQCPTAPAGRAAADKIHPTCFLLRGL